MGPPHTPCSQSSYTHTLCRTHQPQWGSRDPRHSSQDVYCTQLSTGTRVTWGRGYVRPYQSFPGVLRPLPFCTSHTPQ